MDIALTLLPVIVIGAPFILWIGMLLHAAKNNIPNKALWIFVLILTNFFGGIAYYCAVYQVMAKKRGKGLEKRTLLMIGSIVALVIVGVILLSLPTQRSTQAKQTETLQEVPLAEVIRQANNGEISRIMVKGDELKITKQGDLGASEHSWKKPGSSIREQGLTNKNVQVIITSRDVTP